MPERVNEDHGKKCTIKDKILEKPILTRGGYVSDETQFQGRLSESMFRR